MSDSTPLANYLKLHSYVTYSDYETHFGPNYKTLLNFWTYLDTLSCIDLEHLSCLYFTKSQDRYRWYANNDKPSLEVYASTIIPHQFDVWNCSFNQSHLGYAALEIVAMHKIIHDGLTVKHLTIFDTL